MLKSIIINSKHTGKVGKFYTLDTQMNACDTES